MRKIDKRAEPVEWRQYRCSPGASFDSDGAKSAKEKLREALMQEQGYVCAYCQRRITPDKDTRIEHIISQSIVKGDPNGRNPDNESDRWWFDDKERFYGRFDELHYPNLVLCCDGNISGTKYGRQNSDNFHCDRSKGDYCIHFDLFSDQFIRTVSYKSHTGRIESSNPGYDKEINEVLKLNLSQLCRNRLATLEAVKQALDKIGWSRSNIARILCDYDSMQADGFFRPYNGIVTWYLRRALARQNP